MNDIDLIRQQYRDGLDLDWYFKMQALQIFMTGDYKVLADYLGGSRSSENEGGDLPDFPAINPKLDQRGLQNHGLVNARINIQNIAHSRPEFIVSNDNGMIRKMISAWLMAHWRTDRWGRTVYRAGMQLEATGLAQAEVGMIRGMTRVRYRSILDSVFPRLADDPAEWPYWFVRERVPAEKAWTRYGMLFPSRQDFDSYLVDLPFPIRESQIPTSTRGDNERVKCLHVWRYYNVEGKHVEFLGSVMNEAKSCVVRLDNDFNREKATDGMAGLNPFGERIPAAFWVDSWCPGISKPVGKAETTVRIAAMLNEVEEAIVKFFRRSPPQVLLDPTGMSPEMVEKLKTTKNIDDIWEVVIVEAGGDIEKAMFRVPAAEIGETWWNIRTVLKQELATSTGLAEVFRGVPVGGERKTRFEMEETMRTWGVQPRHLAMTASDFIVDICNLAMHIGAEYETVEIPLNMKEGTITTKTFPIESILRLMPELDIKESSLTGKSEDEILQEETGKLIQVDIPGIQAGVNDPYKVFAAFYEKIGEDPNKKMFSLQEYQMQKLAKMQAEQQQAEAQAKVAQGGKPPAKQGAAA